MVTYERWSLGEIKARVRAEFNFDDTAHTNDMIADKANQAVAWIVRRRPNWPWQRREFSLDVDDGESAVGDFTKGSREITGSAFGTDWARRIFVPGSSTHADNTNGYLIESSDGVTVTLQSQYRGTTDTDVPFQVHTGFLALPEAVVRVDTSTQLTGLGEEEFNYVPPTQFEKLKNRRPYLISGDRFFTVKPDPLGLNGTFYIAVYPFISSITTIRGEYFTIPPALVDDSDEPILPINDRACIFYFTCQFIAMAKADERAGFFSAMAQQELERMTVEYALAEDHDRGMLIPTTLRGPDQYEDVGDPEDYFPNSVVVP